MAKVSAQPVKGTRDFLPADVRRRRYATEVIRAVYEAHGFEPLETPTLERLDALSGKYGEEGDQLMFRVLLRGQPLVQGIRQAAEHLRQPGALVQGRSGETAPGAGALLADLGLRYDLTVPLARAYAAHQAALPAVFKRYQIQPVWRADTPGKGRYREFYQCDVDVVGSESRLVEVEVASAGCECIEKLGFDEFRLRVNHRGLLRAIVEKAGIAPELEVDAITAIDKLDKVGRAGVEKELTERGVSEGARGALLGLVAEGAEGSASLARAKAFVQGSPLGEQAIAELSEFFSLAEHTHAARHARFDLALARGLGYYTGCIFEFAIDGLSGSVGGGGRYDGLIGMFLGKQVPACGLALGFERLILLMEERDLFPKDLGQVQIQLAAAPGEDLARALRLSRQLREAGFTVSLSPKEVKPGKLRKAASLAGAAFAVWLEGGELHYWSHAGDEIARGLDEARLLAALS